MTKYDVAGWQAEGGGQTTDAEAESVRWEDQDAHVSLPTRSHADGEQHAGYRRRRGRQRHADVPAAIGQFSGQSDAIT